jgi:hypothetical protein
MKENMTRRNRTKIMARKAVLPFAVPANVKLKLHNESDFHYANAEKLDTQISLSTTHVLQRINHRKTAYKAGGYYS